MLVTCRVSDERIVASRSEGPNKDAILVDRISSRISSPPLLRQGVVRSGLGIIKAASENKGRGPSLCVKRRTKKFNKRHDNFLVTVVN
jgi:hypothetical protein